MRSLLVLVLLAGSATAGSDTLIRKIAGHQYEVTATYTQGPPPDCGQTPRGFRQCPAPRTTTVTRVITATAENIVVSGRCADLAPLPSPDPNIAHLVGAQQVTPRGKAPKLPLCERG